MSFYVVKCSETDKILGSRKKKFFTSIGHIKTAGLYSFVESGDAYIEYYNLNNIKPRIII